MKPKRNERTEVVLAVVQHFHDFEDALRKRIESQGPPGITEEVKRRPRPEETEYA